MPLEHDDVAWARQAARALPQPVAYAMGRIARAPSDLERLDWTVRAAETIARYVALIGSASFAARDDVDAFAPLRKKPWQHGIAFNRFVELAIALARCDTPHPLRAALNSAFIETQAHEGIESAGAQAFAQAVRFRNANAHGLQGMSERKARSLIPGMFDALRSIVDATSPLLAIPIVIFEQQSFREGQVVARILPLVGEGEPFPVEVALDRPVTMTDAPYLICEAGLLPLAPGMAWDTVDLTFECRLFLLDKASPPPLYRTGTAGEAVALTPAGGPDAQEWITGACTPLEMVRSAHGVAMVEVLRVDASGDTEPRLEDLVALEPPPRSYVEPRRDLRPFIDEDHDFTRRARAAAQITALAAVVEGLQRAGLVLKQDKYGIKVESPRNRTFFIAYVSLGPKGNPRLRLGVGEKGLVSLYGCTPDQIRRVFPDKRLIDDVDAVDAVLGDLFSLLRPADLGAPELVDMSSSAKDCMARLENWASAWGLIRSDDKSSVRFETPGGRPVVYVFPEEGGWVSLAIEWAARNGRPGDAASLLERIRLTYDTGANRRWQRMFCDDLVGRWPAFEGEVLDRLAGLHGLERSTIVVAAQQD